MAMTTMQDRGKEDADVYYEQFWTQRRWDGIWEDGHSDMYAIGELNHDPLSAQKLQRIWDVHG